MLDATLVDDAMLSLIRTACAIERGELLSVHIDSFPTLPPRREYASAVRVLDAGAPPGRGRAISDGVVTTGCWGTDATIRYCAQRRSRRA